MGEPASASEPVLVAREEFDWLIDGEMVHVAVGERVAASHPIAQKRPEAFERVEGARFGVEQTTAAPGERRNR